MPSAEINQFQHVLMCEGYEGTLRHGTDKGGELEKQALTDFQGRAAKLGKSQDFPNYLDQEDLLLHTGNMKDHRKEPAKFQISLLDGKQCLAAQKSSKAAILNDINPLWTKLCGPKTVYPSGKTHDDMVSMCHEALWVSEGGLSVVRADLPVCVLTDVLAGRWQEGRRREEEDLQPQMARHD